MCIWLYAGNSEYPALLAAYSGSDNATGADNQQERLGRRARESSEAIRQTSGLPDDEMVPSAWRHAVNVIKGVTFSSDMSG
jgi:hypothetical protein